MAPHPAPCGGRGSMVDVGAEWEEVSAAGVGSGVAEAEIGGSSGGRIGGEPVRDDGACVDSLFSPSCFPPRGLPPLPVARHRESTAGSGSMVGGSRVVLYLDVAADGERWWTGGRRRRRRGSRGRKPG
jgi:hypothetical protein